VVRSAHRHRKVVSRAIPRHPALVGLITQANPDLSFKYRGVFRHPMKVWRHMVVRRIFHPEDAEARQTWISEENGAQEPRRHGGQARGAFFALQWFPLELRSFQKNSVVSPLIGYVQRVSHQCTVCHDIDLLNTVLTIRGPRVSPVVCICGSVTTITEMTAQ